MLNLLGPAPSQHLLSAEDIVALKHCLEKDTTVTRGGDICTSSNHLHVLVDGWAAKYKLLERGRRQLIGLHLGSEVCDMDRLFCADLGYGVCALSDCRVVTISIERFRKLADTNASVRNLFWSMMALENVSLVEQVTTVGSRPARERVAYFLCDLVIRLQARGLMHGRTFRLEMIQSEVAEYLGLSVVHTNRMLRGLMDEKALEVRGSRYTILDFDRLKAAAGDAEEPTSSIAWRAYEASSVLRTTIKSPPRQSVWRRRNGAHLALARPPAAGLRAGRLGPSGA